MIIRRATQVVAGTTMPGSATPWLPGARQSMHGAPAARYGVASSSGRHCSALRGLARSYHNPYGAGFCERSALSGSWRRGSTIRVVAFRASHPAKPPPRQRRFIQRFLKEVPNKFHSTSFSNFRISAITEFIGADEASVSWLRYSSPFPI